MSKEVRELSLDSLFERLHRLMSNLVKDIDSVIEDNKEVGMADVRELREHISTRLNKKEEIKDNEKLLKLLNLFSEDKAVLEIIREDAEEWVDLLDAIEESIRATGLPLTNSEQNEIKEIKRLTAEIKSLIRKE
jgi:transcriptional regulator of heat shock response